MFLEQTPGKMPLIEMGKSAVKAGLEYLETQNAWDYLGVSAAREKVCGLSSRAPWCLKVREIRRNQQRRPRESNWWNSTEIREFQKSSQWSDSKRRVLNRDKHTDRLRLTTGFGSMKAIGDLVLFVSGEIKAWLEQDSGIIELTPWD